jgi:L-phenylalanine/L-methionine N-acetyltransferase
MPGLVPRLTPKNTYIAAMIRKINGQDFDFIYELYMHPQVNRYLLYEPMPPDEFKDIFKDLLANSWVYIFEEKGTPAGMFKLIPLTHRTSHIAYLGGVAIHPSFSGQGLGLEMIKEILLYAGDRGFLRVELSVLAANEKAIRLYEKAGFEKEGVLRKYSHLKKENIFLDEIMMSWLA